MNPFFQCLKVSADSMAGQDARNKTVHASFGKLNHLRRPAMTSSFIYVLVLTASFFQDAQAQKNLLLNPSFESDTTGTWQNNGFAMERISYDTRDGRYSILCKDRDRDIEGPLQDVKGLVPGGRYAFQGYVKLLNDTPGTVWQSIKVSIQFFFNDTTGGSASYIVAWRGFATKSNGWMTVIGDFTGPMRPFKTARLSIRGPLGKVNFLVDNLTLWEVPEFPNWEGTAHTFIERYRKTDMQFRVTLPSGVNPADITIQIDHKKHLFAFGSKFDDELMSDNKYLSLFYYLFNWATVGSYKWRFDKGQSVSCCPAQSNPDFSDAVRATDELLKNGLKIRAHSILWGVEENIPDWVRNVSVQELPGILRNHVSYMINLTRGKVQQWDVQNEFLHGHYYEEKLQGPNVTLNLYKLASSLDPQAKLYLNDYTAVTSGANTEDYYDLAQYFKASGTGLGGLGIQGHTKDFIKPDPTMMWRHLDRLSQTGLELFMTEFDLGWPDEYVRADWFEDTLRAFFAHPGLSGIVLWGFWNLKMRYENQYLVYGQNMEIAEPGKRWACLVKKEWSTHVTTNLGTSGLIFNVRGFQGEYQVVVKRRGIPVQKMVFVLNKSSTPVTVKVNVTTQTSAISVTNGYDFVPECVSRRNQHSVGVATSVSTDSRLSAQSCVDRLSAVSGSLDAAEVSVTCQAGEILTGCSSVHRMAKSTRRGEQIVVEGGVVKCKAYNGANSPDGVIALARCCRLQGLTCDYRVAGPSLSMDGARAEAKCPDGYQTFGCSAYSRYSDFDGTFPNLNKTSCLAQSGPPISSIPAERSGVIVGAACCRGSGIQCTVIKSAPSALTAGQFSEAACPSSYVMTGCNVYGVNGGTGGAFISVRSGISYCTAYNGNTLPPMYMGVIAIATCCQRL